MWEAEESVSEALKGLCDAVEGWGLICVVLLFEGYSSGRCAIERFVRFDKLG